MRRCSQCNIEKELTEYFKIRKNKLTRLTTGCKKCHRERGKAWGKTRNGVISELLSDQKKRSKKRGHTHPDYTSDEFKGWIISQDRWELLYIEWVRSGYNKWKKPSCDRNNSLLPYTLDNITLMTWRENFNNYCNDVKSGIDRRSFRIVIGTCVKTGVKKQYKSIISAQRDGFNTSHISGCCQGKRKTTGGFSWRYI